MLGEHKHSVHKKISNPARSGLWELSLLVGVCDGGPQGHPHVQRLARRMYRIQHIVVVMAKVYYGNVVSILFFHNDRVMVWCVVAQVGAAFLKTCSEMWSCH